jgi:hypothetical protein
LELDGAAPHAAPRDRPDPVEGADLVLEAARSVDHHSSRVATIDREVEILVLARITTRALRTSRARARV